MTLMGLFARADMPEVYYSVIHFAMTVTSRRKFGSFTAARMHWCMTHQIKARELNLVGYEDEDD